MSVPRHQRGQLYGTGDFTAALAAREAALGLGAPEPDFADVAETIGLDVSDVAPSEPADDAPEPRGNERRDAWGNVIVSGPRLNGAYVMRSQWGDGRVVYVCGAPEQHVRQGYWRRDGRMDGNGQGFICCACWTVEAGLYGKDGR